MATVTPSTDTSVDYSSAAYQSRVPDKNLTQTDFLQIIVENLKQQDPTNAQDSSKYMDDYMNLANFQATQDSANNVNKLRNYQTALSLIGANVGYTNTNGDAVTGVPSKVSFDASGTSYITIGTDTVTIDKITSVSAADTTSTP